MSKKKKKSEPKSLKTARKEFKAELKATKVPTKTVEIRKDQEWGCNQWSYAFARPKAETWSTGYARPFTARRGAERHFKDFIAKGGKLVFINNY